LWWWWLLGDGRLSAGEVVLLCVEEERVEDDGECEDENRRRAAGLDGSEITFFISLAVEDACKSLDFQNRDFRSYSNVKKMERSSGRR
jgi:hypothetical protein